MKKSSIIILFCLMFYTNAFTQSFSIKHPDSGTEVVLTKDIQIVELKSASKDIKSIEIKYIEEAKDKTKYYISYALESGFSNPRELIYNEGNFEELVYDEAIRNKTFKISKDKSTFKDSYQFIMNFNDPAGDESNKPNGGGTDDTIKKVLMEAEYINNNYQPVYSSSYGIKVTVSPLSNIMGDDFVHLFFDQFGNSLLSAIPNGVPHLKYVVHIIYYYPEGEEMKLNYSVTQTDGGFDDAIFFRNSGALSGLNFESTDNLKIAEKIFILAESNKDITFEIYRNSITNLKDWKLNKELISKHTIKMTKVYYGSFDVGLLISDLSNPTYELAILPEDPSLHTVKTTNEGKRGMITAMATFYMSPVVLIKSWILDKENRTSEKDEKQILKYKRFGRNYIEDHTLFERIFPAVGVSLNEKAFENFFYGLNWEIARGGSIFIGAHTGYVNTYDFSDNFEYGKTSVTSEEFNLNIDKKWKTGFVIGANLDVKIISNLFNLK